MSLGSIITEDGRILRTRLEEQNCHGKERIHDKENFTGKQYRPRIEKKNSEMHGVERGTVWSAVVDYDAKSPEELGSV